MFDMSIEEFGQWKTNPTTEKFFRWLNDRRIQMAEDVAASLAAGVTIEKSYADDVALRCEIYLDLESLDFGDIANFYQGDRDCETIG